MGLILARQNNILENKEEEELYVQKLKVLLMGCNVYRL